MNSSPKSVKKVARGTCPRCGRKDIALRIPSLEPYEHRCAHGNTCKSFERRGYVVCIQCRRMKAEGKI